MVQRDVGRIKNLLGKEMYKKGCCTCKVVVLLIKHKIFDVLAAVAVIVAKAPYYHVLVTRRFHQPVIFSILQTSKQNLQTQK